MRVLVMRPQNKEDFAYQLFAKEFESLQSSHGLSSGLDISKHNVCLSTHLFSPQSHHVENWAIGREENVESGAQVGLLYLGRGQVADVETLVWRVCGGASSLARTSTLFLLLEVSNWQYK